MTVEFGRWLPAGLVALAFFAWLSGNAVQQPTLADDAPIEITQDAEITAVLAGKTLYGKMPNGARWVEYYDANGGSAYREDQEACGGKWRVSGNIVCFMYPFYKNGEPNCFNLWRSGSNILFVVAGSAPNIKDDIEVIDRIASGDPESLMATVSPACR